MTNFGINTLHSGVLVVFFYLFCGNKYFKPILHAFRWHVVDSLSPRNSSELVIQAKEMFNFIL